MIEMVMMMVMQVLMMVMMMMMILTMMTGSFYLFQMKFISFIIVFKFSDFLPLDLSRSLGGLARAHVFLIMIM